jgi:hypothetical protein
MRVTKRKGDESTVRIIREDNGAFYGVIGTVADLLAARIFEICDASEEKWAFIRSCENEVSANFYDTRDEAIAAARRSLQFRAEPLA